MSNRIEKSVFMVEKEEDDDFISIPVGVEYVIELKENELTAKRIVYPVRDKHGNFCDNKYEDEYVIKLYTPGWARLEKWRFNKGFASMEHTGAWDTVLLFRKIVAKGEAKKLINKIKRKLKTLKDNDPKIKTLVEKVIKFFDKKIAKYEDC